MGIMKPFSEVKCGECDSNGFIIRNSLAVKCECRIKYERELRTSDSLLKSGLLDENSNYSDFKRLFDFKFSDYYGKDENGNISRLQKYCDEFDSDVKPFRHLHCYVWGEQGCQKSYVMRGLLAKMARKGKQVSYIFAKNLIALIIDAERDEIARKKLDYIIDSDILVIDEFEEKRCALWQSNYKERSLIVWLKDRLEVIRKSTWFVSNDSVEKLKESKFGELFGDLIERETMYGRFEFKDNYVNCLDKKETMKIMSQIWD